MANLREEEALLAIKGFLGAGVPPAELLSACQKGMRLVGAMHEKGKYYIAGLIMAGEIMRQAVDLLRPAMVTGGDGKTFGRVLLGTIEGDIHDIGKNLFRDLLECHGFKVLDLGVDVPPAEFIAAQSDFKPHLVAASALITDSFAHLRELVQLFEDAARSRQERRPFILIGGGQVDERIFRMSGADQWGEDAFSGIHICQKLLRESRPKRGSGKQGAFIPNS
ncbi:putative cobalamin binding protein [Syntrophobacter sp. SbD1]|nr:putative cobalamin binding protein [Syntrophobacter sp. SbD1]